MNNGGLWGHLKPKDLGSAGYDGQPPKVDDEDDYPKRWQVEKPVNLAANHLTLAVSCNGEGRGMIFCRDEAEVTFIKSLFAGRNVQVKHG